MRGRVALVGIVIWHMWVLVHWVHVHPKPILAPRSRNVTCDSGLAVLGPHQVRHEDVPRSADERMPYSGRIFWRQFLA